MLALCMLQHMQQPSLVAGLHDPDCSSLQLLERELAGLEEADHWMVLEELRESWVMVESPEPDCRWPA